MDFGEPGDPLVNLDLYRLVHLRVLKDLLEAATVAAADYPDPFRIGVGIENRVRHHFVIEEFITVRYHGAAINNHELAEPLCIVNLNLLERGLLLVELSLQL